MQNNLGQNTPIVLITGASSGIGRSLAINCIKNGYKVVGIARREEKLKELKAELNNNNFSYYAVDVTSIDSLKEILSDLQAKNLEPNIVVSSAGIFESDTHPYNREAIRKTMEINFFGTINLVDIFLEDFLKKGRGHFISISSIASWRPSLRGISYPASKSAIAMAFRGLNLRYQKEKVNFSTIYLGPVETEMWEGKKSIFVSTPKKVSKKIMRLMLNPQPISYIPFLSTTLSRLSSLIPDNWYARLSSTLFK